MILDVISNLENYRQLFPRFEAYQEYLTKMNELLEGKYDLGEGEFFSIMSGETRELESAQYEFHQKYLDLQIMLEGSEFMQWQNLDKVDQLNFDAESDIGFGTGPGTLIEIPQNSFYIVYPQDAHMPGLHVEEPAQFKKAVFKLKVN